MGSVVHAIGRLLMVAAVVVGVGRTAAAVEHRTTAAAEHRVALIIGNAAYREEEPLDNPVNDARAMADLLRQQGFEVVARQDAGKADMEEAVLAFGRLLRPDSVGLFYYSGHGMQVNGRNYLLPVDTAIGSEAEARLRSVDVDSVLEQMMAKRTRLNIVILDACRNNPFERRFRALGAGGGLAQVNAPQGTLIAYATAPGQTASDGTAGSNGLYTGALLRAMREPGVPIEQVFKRVRITVAGASGGAQVPWEASSLVGEFFFGGGGAAQGGAQTAAVPPAPNPAPAQSGFFQSPNRPPKPQEPSASTSRPTPQDAAAGASRLSPKVNAAVAAAREAADRGTKAQRAAGEARARAEQAADRARRGEARHVREEADDEEGGVYAGQVNAAGEWHGYGVVTWPEGESYAGQWRDSGAYGVGVYTYKDGDRYEGDMSDGESEGHGVLTDRKGGRYAGAFSADVQSGHGVYTGADGVRYEGRWEDDEPHGYGLETRPDGRTLAGAWNEGSYVAPTAAFADTVDDDTADDDGDDAAAAADEEEEDDTPAQKPARHTKWKTSGH